jgi:hypothetical protein
MDFYDVPVADTFALSRFHWFDMPKNNSSVVKVIAVSSKEASYWVVAYAIIVTLIFAAVTRMAVDLVLAFLPLKGSGNRVIMLVAFYNANNPTTAALLMSDYCRHALFNTKVRQGTKKTPKVDWNTLQCALTLMAIAGALIGASTTAQFLVSGRQLIERRATRANPNVLFYPNFLAAQDTGQLLDQLKPIRGSAGYQALGRYETSRKNLDKRVRVDTIELPRINNSRVIQFDYTYELTGYEMGLQDAALLKYGVNGTCKTNYAAYNESGNRDYWYIWPDYRDADYPNGYRDAYNPIDEQLMAPFIGDNLLPGQTKESIKKNGSIFSLLPHTEYRLSSQENLDDPWYMTERNLDYNASDTQKYAYGGQLRIKRGRPVLNCVQYDNFTLGNGVVYHVSDLKYLPGLKLSNLLRDKVFPQEFAIPVVTVLARLLAYNGVASTTYFDPPSRIITADKASLSEDFKRLVAVAFLYSREAARNVALLYSTLDGKGLENVAKVNGTVSYKDADIILESADVAALSVPVLLITPIVCVVVWLLVLIRRYCIQPAARTDNEGPLARLNLNTIGLQATQLYRCLDEVLSNTKKWSGRLSMTPYIEEVVVDKNRKRESGDTTEAGQALHNTGQDDNEPFVLPKLVPVERAQSSSPPPKDSKMLCTEEENQPADSDPKSPPVRVDSEGRTLKEDGTFDLVITNRKRPKSTTIPSTVTWDHVRHDVDS